MSRAPQGGYQEACRLAEAGDYQQAAEHFRQLEASAPSDRERALIANDLGVLNSLIGDVSTARLRLEAALRLDSACVAARENLLFLNHEANRLSATNGSAERGGFGDVRTKVAVISFLFNWPSTGGGIAHTVELCRFLAFGGYQVQLFYADYRPWSIGQVAADCPFPGESLRFAPSDWTVRRIQERFREAIDRFGPDAVIITDCWNFKPQLAEAVQGIPYLLRMQAHECLCPLNNLRLRPHDTGEFIQCPHHQLADAALCRECVRRHEQTSGELHRVERALSGTETGEYQQKLHAMLQGAEAVLVLNPLIAEVFRPYCRRVEVVTWGMDSRRFPWPLPEQEAGPDRVRLLFAGLASEAIKGFEVLQEACGRIWTQRQDFELVATCDRAGQPPDSYTRFVGWQSQADLPGWYRRTDLCVVPTIAQEGLSRTAVEAMASGRPVIASRIGGLPFAVEDGVTGLLCEPGHVADWAEKIVRLLDDRELRAKLGRAGRERFEGRFRWESVIEQAYSPLLSQCRLQKTKA